MTMIGGTGPRPAPVRPSDDDWTAFVEGAARGDQNSLSRLYDASSRLVYGIALRILGDPADAEEVTLDVFSQVWRSAKDYSRDKGTVSSWLIMMARSRALDRARSRGRRQGRETAIDASVDAVESAAGPEEATFLRLSAVRVRGAISALAPEQRELIELSFFSGLTHTELAERMGQPLGTVKTRIRAGMTKLREAIGVSKEVQ